MGTAWLVVFGLEGSVATATPYLDLVARYAKGQRGPAVAELGDWTEKDLARELDRLRAWERRARRCEACEEKQTFSRLPLRAAVLLHTDRNELERRSRSPVDEASPRCGIGPHGLMAEEVALLVMLKREGHGFVRRWYLAMTLQSHANGCMADALIWVGAGLKWLPNDADRLPSVLWASRSQSVSFGRSRS